MSRMIKILIADDDPMNLKFLKEILEDSYTIRTLSSGENVLKETYRFKPNIILLDIMMPGLTGYEVCEQIKADKSLSHIKILLVSAKAMLDEKLRGYDVGADDYITKPFEHEELLAKIKIFLRL